MFNKDLEEIKKSQSIMNNAITEIKSTLEGTNSRITEAAPKFKSINSSVLSFLYSPTLTSIHDYWKKHSLD